MADYVKNEDKIKNYLTEQKPFIALDVEATGIMNGNDNRITQIAAAAYSYNPESSQYELQDHVFLQAKADKELLDNIEQRENPSHENIIQLLKEDCFYEISKEISKIDERINYFTTNLNTYQAELAQKQIELNDKNNEFQALKGLSKKELTEADKDRISTLKKEITALNKEIVDHNDKNGNLVVASLNKKILTAKQKISDWQSKLQKHKDFIKDFEGMDKEEIISSEKFQQYFNGAYSQEDYLRKKAELEQGYKLNDILTAQGIDRNGWVQSGEGLSVSEMQLGLSEFFKNNFNQDTIMISSGTHYTKHYLEKENISLPQNAEMTSVTSLVGSNNRYTSTINEFVNGYQQRTGKQVNTLDAFTKALCIAEISCEFAGTKVYQNSEKHIEHSLKEQAFACDSDYVMTKEKAEDVLEDNSAVLENTNESYEYMNEGYQFDTAECIDLGNDRRFVDIDKMFDLNDNFEITIEGEKEPIKSWEELENKIRAYNANISEQLIDKIKVKFMEMQKKAEIERSKAEAEQQQNSPLSSAEQIDISEEKEPVAEPSTINAADIVSAIDDINSKLNENGVSVIGYYDEALAIGNSILDDVNRFELINEINSMRGEIIASNKETAALGYAFAFKEIVNEPIIKDAVQTFYDELKASIPLTKENISFEDFIESRQQQFEAAIEGMNSTLSELEKKRNESIENKLKQCTKETPSLLQFVREIKGKVDGADYSQQTLYVRMDNEKEVKDRFQFEAATDNDGHIAFVFDDKNIIHCYTKPYEGNYFGVHGDEDKVRSRLKDFALQYNDIKHEIINIMNDYVNSYLMEAAEKERQLTMEIESLDK